MAEDQVQHRAGCRTDLRGIESGYAEATGPDFIQEYLNPVEFDITCLGCCHDFLVSQRNYRQMVGVERVHFTNQNVSVSCIVRKSQSSRGANGQIVTGNDPDLGEPSELVISGGRSFQLYNPTGVVAVGTINSARIERLTIDNATQLLVSHIYLNYADAALMELYRTRRQLASLNGICTLKSEEERERERKREKEREVERDLKGLESQLAQSKMT